jgi:hypothetical protein
MHRAQVRARGPHCGQSRVVTPLEPMHHTAAAALLSLALLPMGTAAQAPQRLFYSGHSLLDEPLPGDVAMVAASLGTPLQTWRKHTPAGSSIRDRLALAAEARPGPGFDTLLVTEQHTLITNLVWNDSARQLRRLHDDFIAANPRGRTWFYASWVYRGADTQRWIAYERAASPVWQCLTTRLNDDLAAQGRSERIAFLPAAALLAGLVERTDRGELPGIGVAQLFRDDVHLTALGSYFMSLAVFATLFERSPVGAAIPSGLDAPAARALQGAAWALVQQERAQRQALSAAACQQRTRDFVAPYAAYVRDAIDRPREGAARAWWLWAKHRLQWGWALR